MKTQFTNEEILTGFNDYITKTYVVYEYELNEGDNEEELTIDLCIHKEFDLYKHISRQLQKYIFDDIKEFRNLYINYISNMIDQKYKLPFLIKSFTISDLYSKEESVQFMRTKVIFYVPGFNIESENKTSELRDEL